MPTNWNNDKNIAPRAEASETVDLVVGDEVELIYEDSPETVIRATIRRVLTDDDECMGPEVRDYVAAWFEIELAVAESEDAGQHSLRDDAWRRTMTLGTDFRYSLDGRRVAVRKP